MKNAQFKLNNQLDKDTHTLFIESDFHVLLHKNASIPWIILVPQTNVTEVYELPTDMQKSLNNITTKIAVYFKGKFKTEKMNIAAIGNIVSQLHIHVIGRKADDACWPDVVWGNSYPFQAYTLAEIGDLKNTLR